MDKPIRTLKEWHSKKSSPCVGLVGSILRDWARDREILEARIAELKEDLRKANLVACLVPVDEALAILTSRQAAKEVGDENT